MDLETGHMQGWDAGTHSFSTGGPQRTLAAKQIRQLTRFLSNILIWGLTRWVPSSLRHINSYARKFSLTSAQNSTSECQVLSDGCGADAEWSQASVSAGPSRALPLGGWREKREGKAEPELHGNGAAGEQRSAQL